MMSEETLASLVTDPEGKETAPDILKKTLDMFRGIRGKEIKYSLNSPN